MSDGLFFTVDLAPVGRAGYRLHRLEVFNWRTFDKQAWQLTPAVRRHCSPATSAAASRRREISVPGVDTKFAERHRASLAALLGAPSTGTGFLAAFGLRAKPEFVRLRFSPRWAYRRR